MTMRSWIRKLFAQPVTRPIRKAPRRIRLGSEALEDRVVPAGGLLSEFLGNGIVQIQADQGETIRIVAEPDGGAEQLTSFFSAPDGKASKAIFTGTMTAGGETVTGAFEFREVSATGGVEVMVTNGTVRLGETAGIELTAASGAFALVSTGAAGVLRAADGPAGTEVAAFGLPGLNVKSTGLSFELNTTGLAVNRTVVTPFGPVAIAFPDGSAVKDMNGPVEFVVSGASDPVVRVAGAFVITEDGDGLALAGEQVGVDLYAGDLRVITLGSATAGFALTEEAFALDEGSFTVGGFMILPQGEPTAPGAGHYSEDQITISANLGPFAIEELGLIFDGFTFGPGGLSVDVGLSAASASLEFAAASASVQDGDDDDAYGLTATFELAAAVDPDTGLVGDFGASGGFAITADSFNMEVPGLLTASAEGLTIQYDPSAEGPQTLIEADAVTVEVPKLKLLGEFASTEEFPALQIRTDGFAFGSGRVTYTGTVTFGPADDPTVAITNPYVELGNFNFSTSTGVHLGLFTIGAGEVAVSASKGKFTGVGTDLRLEVGLNDDSMVVESVVFSVAKLELNYTATRPGAPESGDLPPLLTLTASNVALNPLKDNTVR